MLEKTLGPDGRTDLHVTVNEVRHSDFEKANDAWLQPPTGGKPPPMA